MDDPRFSTGLLDVSDAARFLGIGIVGQQHHQNAAASQYSKEIAPADHARPPYFDAARMAAVILGYVPQRQMWPFIPLTISASLGLGVRRSKDTAPMIMPGVQ